MKQTNINIDEIKRFPTVTYPILADDLHTPQAYAFTLRRAIVTDCNDRQRAELVELLEGKETAEGVTFNNTKVNRERLHRWQNRESRKERAAILGKGWEYIVGLNHGTQPGDLITCIDGTRGRVTKASEESCVIEFETENGQRLSVGGYFREERNYSTSEKSEPTRNQEIAKIILQQLGGRQFAMMTGCINGDDGTTHTLTIFIDNFIGFCTLSLQRLIEILVGQYLPSVVIFIVRQKAMLECLLHFHFHGVSMAFG